MSGFTCRVGFAEEECTRIGMYEMESSFFFDADQFEEYWNWIYGTLGVSWEYPDEDPEEHREKSGESS